MIRYVYRTAETQSRLPEPMCSMSLLTFHDAVELFLVLAAQYLDVSTKDRSFMQYWELLSAKMKDGGSLTQKESMRRLNEARVNFKHHGTLPHKSDIDGYRYSVEAFFGDNTPLVFNVSFGSISMVSLVKCEEARQCLDKAETHAKEEQWTEAVCQTALAFQHLLDDYENRKRTGIGRSLFSVGESMNFNTSFHLGVNDHKWKKFIDGTSKSISSLQNAVKMLIFGVDYRRYAVFQMLTPFVIRTTAGLRLESSAELTHTEEDYRFCQEFVVESALSIQDFDFNVQSLSPMSSRPVFE